MGKYSTLFTKFQVDWCTILIFGSTIKFEEVPKIVKVFEDWIFLKFLDLQFLSFAGFTIPKIKKYYLFLNILREIRVKSFCILLAALSYVTKLKLSPRLHPFGKAAPKEDRNLQKQFQKGPHAMWYRICSPRGHLAPPNHYTNELWSKNVLGRFQQRMIWSD